MKNQLFNSSNLRIATFLLLAIVCFTCRKDQSSEEITDMETVKTQNKFLKGVGINSYQFKTENPNNLLVEYESSENKLSHKISYIIDTLYRTSEIKFNNRDLSFSMILDERGHKFMFKSSNGDNKVFVFKRNESPEDPKIIQGGWYDEKTNEIVEPSWYLHLGIDSKLMFEAYSIVGELESKKHFINPISVIKARENNFILKSRAKTLMSAKQNTSTTLNNPCDGTCGTGSYYGFWRSVVCDEAMQALPAACSNNYCIGNCGSSACDCVSLTGDFAVVCVGHGHACSGTPSGGE